MFGQQTGLAGQLKRLNQFLVTYHCASHRHQLGHVGTEKSSVGTYIAELDSIVDSTCKLLDKNNVLQNKCVERSQGMKETQKGLRSTQKSDTRWVYKRHRIRQYRRSMLSRAQTLKKNECAQVREKRCEAEVCSC
jgi:hypothetical protein